MTQTDPFATPDAKSTAPAPQDFGQPTGGGGYPKPIELNGSLLILEVGGSITMQPGQNKDDNGQPIMVKRAEATTHVVLAGPDAAEYAGQSFDDMFWSQMSMVKSLEKAAAKGQKMLLGTLRRFPQNVEKGKPNGCQTWQEIEQAFDDYRDRKRRDEPKFAWALEQYTEADAVAAREYLAGR